MNFYKQLEIALNSSNINTKELIVNKAIEYCQNKSATFSNFTPKKITEPSYAKICKIVEPKELPQRRDFTKKSHLIALIHTIAHIEYSAIDLAIDAVYTFTNMPREYKLDWLIVAQDEIRHFKMLHSLLEKLGAKYGDLPVQKKLFEMAYKTRDSAIDRMAIIPRYYEAGGLDANPKIVDRIKHIKNPILKELKEALNIIYIEEIDHVKKGDKWFKYLCKEQNLEPQNQYIKILQKYNLQKRNSNFNIKARKEAGFSCDELINLGAKKCD